MDLRSLRHNTLKSSSLLIYGVSNTGLLRRVGLDTLVLKCYLRYDKFLKRLPSVDEMRGLPSFESGFGKGQVILDFENSTVRLPSAERDIRKSAVFNDGIWFGLNVLTGSYRDDPYNCFFQQSGSVETQDAVNLLFRYIPSSHLPGRKPKRSESLQQRRKRRVVGRRSATH
ncbi:hypothetical protein Tco_1097389 [Tanacetum coccineum]